MSKRNAVTAIVASRLKLAREMAGLSQAQVAQLLSLHRPSISEAEAGRRRVTAEELSRLAEIYDVGIAWLVGREQEDTCPDADRVHLAARELSKLKSDDLNRVLKLLRALRKSGGSSQ